MKKLKFLFNSLLVLILLNCNKSDTVDLSNLQTYHHVAIPLVSAEIDVQDMLESDTGGVISTGSQGELYLAYTTPPISLGASEIITLSDEVFDFDIPLGSLSALPPGLPFSGVVAVQDTSIYNFNFPNGEELTSIDFSSGQLTINITNSLKHEITLKITIPSLIDGVTPFYAELVVPANNPSNPGNNTAITQVVLNSYDLDFTQGNVGFNEFIVQIEAIINGSGEIISSSDNLTMSFGLTDMVFDRIDGDLKSQNFELGTEELVFDIFQNSFGALDFQLTNPEIRLDISNSFGFDVYLGMDSMYYEDLTGNFLDHILYDSLGQNQDKAPFYFPVISQPSSPGGTSNNSILMNSSNSSVDELVNSTPKQMITSTIAAINLNSSGINSNYVLSNSEIAVNTEITLPLEGYAGGWSMGGTLPFDFTVDSLFSSNTTIEESVIKFVSTNGWPVEVAFTLELYEQYPDSTQTPLTSIASSEMIIESGVLSANGRVETPTIKVTELACDSACVDNLNKTNFVVINVEANTGNYSNQQAVKIYNDYKLGIEMALLVAGRIF